MYPELLYSISRTESSYFCEAEQFWLKKKVAQLVVLIMRPHTAIDLSSLEKRRAGMREVN
jgi:hypothetical protein